MNKPNLTIHDVAHHLGLSPTTVSFVINGSAEKYRISEATMQRVHHYIQKIGYVPDKRAQSFRTKRTGILGLLVEDLADSSVMRLIKHLESIAFNHGYKLLVQQLDSRQKMQLVLNNLNDKQVEGYFILSMKGLNQQKIRKIQQFQVPFALFSFVAERGQAWLSDCCILEDQNEETAYELFKRLIVAIQEGKK